MPTQYDLKVVSNEILTPHMRRVHLHGASLSGFPPHQESGYVKVLFPQQDSGTRMRSYTIRSFDVDALVLGLDFVDHGDSGLASAWVNQCRLEDQISVRGPGEKKLVSPNADWYFLAGDMAALPALSVNLEKIRDDAVGYCVIEIPCEADKQDLLCPDGVELIWVVNPHYEQPNTVLVNSIRALHWLPGTPYPWFAGEFDAMRSVRKYFRDEKKIDKRSMYVSCYWKIDATDEGMKQAKRLDNDV